MRLDIDPRLDIRRSALDCRTNFIDGASWRFRLVLAIVFLGAFVPLYLVLFESDEKMPLWQRWLAVAVFTPMGLIGEWRVLTARRPSQSKRQAA